MEKNMTEEPALINQPLTFKVTERQKGYLVMLSMELGYSSLSAFLRDMVLLGANLAPYMDRTIKDLLSNANAV